MEPIYLHTCLSWPPLCTLHSEDGVAMRLQYLFSIIIVLLIAGCSTGIVSGPPVLTEPPQRALQRTYNGTAAVGDFLQITVDPNSQTVIYSNLSNDQSNSFPFTVNADGSYEIQDPTGDLSTAYEVPDDLFILKTNNGGADQKTASLAIAVPATPVSIEVLANRTLNYIQFGTHNGGFEIGSGSLSSTGEIDISTYWPLGASFEMSGTTPFHNGTLPVTGMIEDPAGTYFTLKGMNGRFSYVFRDSTGYIIDSPAGTYLALEQAAFKEFDPINSGSYTVVLYQKNGATSTNGADESVPSSYDTGIITISPTGQITLTNSKKQVLAQGTLEPVSDQPSLYNSSPYFSLRDPCYGLFTFHVESTAVVVDPNQAGSNISVPTQQDVFIGFRGETAIIASFTKYLTPGSEGPYDYFYGLGER